MRALFGAAVLVLGFAGSAGAICYPPRSGEDPSRYYECYAQEVENADK